MKATVIQIVIVGLDTVRKGLIQGLEDLKIKKTSGEHPNCSFIGIDQNAEKVLEIEEACCHSNPSKKRSVNAGVKNIQKSFNNNNNYKQGCTLC